MIYLKVIENYRYLFNTLIFNTLRDVLIEAPVVDVGEWHSTDVSGRALAVTRELTHVILEIELPALSKTLELLTRANMPWAENHFQERVSGIPHNPPPSHSTWPWARHNSRHQNESQRFSHTYPERFWPKEIRTPEEGCGGDPGGCEPAIPRRGIRYPYGDLMDVVKQLRKNPTTRQAYLPVWFPEDTGVVHGERVPCTLGYHFLIRDTRLHCTYHIRSCDFVRHFGDDLYMAGRLVQWMCDQLNKDPIGDFSVTPGTLLMVIGSLHVMQGDLPKLLKEAQVASD